MKNKYNIGDAVYVLDGYGGKLPDPHNIAFVRSMKDYIGTRCTIDVVVDRGAYYVYYLKDNSYMWYEDWLSPAYIISESDIDASLDFIRRIKNENRYSRLRNNA